MNKLENKNRQNRVPLSPLKSGLQIPVSHFFYLISQKISHFLNFGRKQTCAVMSGFLTVLLYCLKTIRVTIF